MKRHALTLLLAITGAMGLNASAVYDVTVNTTAIQGTSGYLDFQFFPGTQSDLATATVSNFATNGSLGSDTTAFGDYTPANPLLPGSFTFTNDVLGDEFWQSLTFGQNISFEVTLAGDAFDAPNPSNTSDTSFNISLFTDTTNFTPLLTSDPNGDLATLDILPGGTVTPAALSQVVSVAASVATPEPSSFVLIALGTAGMLLLARKFNRM